MTPPERESMQRLDGIIEDYFNDRITAQEASAATAPIQRQLAPLLQSHEVPTYDEGGAPHLQWFIALCGMRHAQSIGETFDVGRHGGYRHVGAADWQAWDAANDRWQIERRAGHRR
jgi:hypothetical protein